MLFCDSFSILQPTDPIPATGFFGFSLWPVTSQPIRSSLKSLSVNQLISSSINSSANNNNNSSNTSLAELSQNSILAVFSFILKCDEFFIANDTKPFEFPVESFRDMFEPSGFEHPIALSKNQGFCFILTGKNSSVLSRARCISLQQVITARPLKAGSIYNIQPLFDLFPSLSQMSVRYPIVPPPHSKTAFFPTKNEIINKHNQQPDNKMSPRTPKSASRKQGILWQKSDKIQRWRLDLTQITDNLFVSSSIVAQNAELLKKKNITHIINCASQIIQVATGFETLNLPMLDGGDENILSHIWLTTTFIDNAVKNKNGRVLVNCIEGVSRSVSVIIGYMMLTENIDYMTAFKRVRKQRRCASPHPKFMTQLMQLAEILGVTSTRTCPFSKDKIWPFLITERRNLILALPIYDQTVASDKIAPEMPVSEVCSLTIDYQKANSLSKSDPGAGGNMVLKIGCDVQPELVRHARDTAQRISKCLKIDSIVEEKVQLNMSRTVFASPTWTEVHNFNFSDADPNLVFVAFTDDSISVFVGQNVGESVDLTAMLKQCCETHQLHFTDNFAKVDSRKNMMPNRVRFT